MSDAERSRASTSQRLATAFKVAVTAGTLAYLIRGVVIAPADLLHLELVFWAVVIAAVELMPVPAWRGLRFSLSLPVIIAVAILYQPLLAGLVLFVGLWDVREVRREMPLANSLFNRSVFAIMAIVASVVFHEFATIDSPALRFILVGLVAATASYAANVFLVSLVVALESSMSLRTVVAQLRMGTIREFLLNYVGLGIVGLAIAKFFHDVGPWSVLAFGAPLVFARQMFFKSMALEESLKELQERQLVLRALSNRMAEERQDERTQIAAYLHDDLAQSLFQLTLRLEMAKKRLGQGDMGAVGKDLDDISAIKERTSNMVRSLVRDLHRSPIGREGLGEALQSFADEASRDTNVTIAVDVVDVTLPPPIQLLIYQIGREAVMNAMKHAEPHNILIAMHETTTGVELQVRDDGAGFDTGQGQPEGHFGTVMMRERALVAGGTFSIESEVGTGTIVSARFPRVWIEEHAVGDVEAAMARAGNTTPSPSGDSVKQAGRTSRDGGGSGQAPRDPAAASPSPEAESGGRPSAPARSRRKQHPLSA